MNRRGMWRHRGVAGLLAAILLLSLAFGSTAALADDVKYAVETTADGWIKVTNEGGATLGYSPDGGVTLLEEDGYAFKDMNGNGKLDPYEDWRLDSETRAADLVPDLSVNEMSGLMAHPSLMTAETDGSDGWIMESMFVEGTTESLMESVDNGLRVIMSALQSYPAKTQVKVNNNAQAEAEKTSDHSIPVMFSANPISSYISGTFELALAATFDTELVKELYKEASPLYRAVGISCILGPQGDTATEPRWSRVSGTYGEDPALARDMLNAAVSGLQSTYDEDGSDLGWGVDSVLGMMKHYPGDSPAEGGREAHSDYGKYNVYPGEGMLTEIVSFIDGGLNLDSKTEYCGSVMTSYSIAFTDDESYGELVGSGFSKYKIDLLRSYGYEGFICTDGGITVAFTYWGMEDKTPIERTYKSIDAGVDQIMGDVGLVEQVYPMFVENYGEEYARARYEASAERVLRQMFNLGLFENAYCETTPAAKLIDSKEGASFALGAEAATKSIVMLKNENGAIRERSDGEKPTVYIPMTSLAGAGMFFGVDAESSGGLPFDQKTLDRYFNVVTDTVIEESGDASAEASAESGSGEASGGYTIVRASAEELADCDFAIVVVNGPSTGSGYDSATGTYKPISLQYGEYTADSEGVRDPSLAGDYVYEEVNSVYGPIGTYTKENRSYYGESTVASNLSELELIESVAAAMPEGAPTIVCINTQNPVIVSEFEADVDAILIGFGVSTDSFLPILAGQAEPSGLLPLQMPANMETVEAQYEDVPRDMECYVDSAGHVYDFAYGMNWSGVIDDARVAKYAVEPLTEPATPTVTEGAD